VTDRRKPARRGRASGDTQQAEQDAAADTAYEKDDGVGVDAPEKRHVGAISD
jgi:hypothetical protein